MLDSFLLFVEAFVTNAFTIVGVLSLAILGLPRFWVDDWDERLRGWLRQFKPFATPVAVILLFIGSFVAFHDERLSHQETQKALTEAKQVGILQPQLITIDESVKKNSDATYTIYKVVEVKARALPSLLEIRIEAKGILDLEIDPIPTRALFVRNPGRIGPNHITTSIPSPYGTYRFTVRAISDDFLLIHSFK